jgi:V-type H+-transporting ATPase subunit G
MSDRTKRVKDARSEAQKEIDEYKKQKEEEFKKFEAEVRNLEHLVVLSRG